MPKETLELNAFMKSLDHLTSAIRNTELHQFVVEDGNVAYPNLKTGDAYIEDPVEVAVVLLTGMAHLFTDGKAAFDNMPKEFQLLRNGGSKVVTVELAPETRPQVILTYSDMRKADAELLTHPAVIAFMQDKPLEYKDKSGRWTPILFSSLVELLGYIQDPGKTAAPELREAVKSTPTVELLTPTDIYGLVFRLPEDNSDFGPALSWSREGINLSWRVDEINYEALAKNYLCSFDGGSSWHPCTQESMRKRYAPKVG